jgi:Legionella pneumophila major outer membrane protein precursor
MSLLNKKSCVLAASLLIMSTQIEPLAAITLDPTKSYPGPSGHSSNLLGDAQIPSVPHSEMKQGRLQKKQWPMFNPNNLKNSCDLWLNGEMLFWKSNMGSMSYGTTSDSSTSIDDGRVKNLHFDWEFGFRLGLGYRLPHDKWDLFVNYTYVHGKGQGHAGGSDAVVFPVFATNFGSTPINPFFANSAKASWRMNLNMADIELGRTCNVGKWLTIRPFIGVRGLVIDQDYHIGYNGGTIGEDNVSMDNDFWGVGIRMGGNTLWGLGKGVSIYGNGSFSLLSGDFDVHEHENRAGTTLMSVKRDVENVVVTADLALGLQWDYMFSKDRYHLGVKMGWEFDMFFDQNQLFNFLGTNPGGFQCYHDDLSFDGLTLGLRFDF